MADGKIKGPEIEFIKKIARHMDISDKELIALFENPQSSHSHTSFSEAERISHLYKLILMMRIDNETHESEIEALKNFSIKMGIRPVITDQILKKIEESDKNALTAEELLKIFKVYYN